jgi:hypothetical protein
VTIAGDPRSSDGGSGALVGEAGAVQDEGVARAGGPHAGRIRWRRGWIWQPLEQGGRIQRLVV